MDPYLPSNTTGQARLFCVPASSHAIVVALTRCSLSRQHTMKELLDTHWKDKTVSPRCALVQDHPT